jgi:hypothetical protein
VRRLDQNSALRCRAPRRFWFIRYVHHSHPARGIYMRKLCHNRNSTFISIVKPY